MGKKRKTARGKPWRLRLQSDDRSPTAFTDLTQGRTVLAGQACAETRPPITFCPWEALAFATGRNLPNGAEYHIDCLITAALDPEDEEYFGDPRHQ